MRHQTCCFTGHRIIPNQMVKKLSHRLYEEVEKLILQGVTNYCNGGALGFDTLAALTVVGLKKKYPHVRLTMMLPCKNQGHGWSKKDQEIYRYILDSADKIIYTSLYYYNGCMLIRNRRLVDESSYCINYLRNATGGTAYTVRYATEKGLKIISLNENSQSK